MRTSLNTGLGFLAINWQKFRNFITEASADTSKKEQKIRKYFNIYDVFGYGEASNQLELMKEPIANFARRNNVKIDVYEKEDKNTGKSILTTYVTKTDKSVATVRNIEADTNTVYPKEARYTYIANIKGEDTQVAREVKLTREDNFIENFFRNIENMTAEVTK